MSRARQSQRLTIELRGDRRHAELALHGELCGPRAAGLLTGCLAPMLETPRMPCEIILDVCNLIALDEVGLAAILNVLHRAAETQVSFLLQDPSYEVREMVDGACAAAGIPVYQGARGLRLLPRDAVSA